MTTNETRLHDWRIPLMIMHGYQRCLQLKFASMPSRVRKLYNPDDSDEVQRRDDIRYLCGTGWQVGFCMRSGVEIRRNRGPRIGSGGNGSIEFRNSGQEERNQSGVPFCHFFSSLLFTILLYFFGSWPSTQGVGVGFYHLQVTAQWRCSFPLRRIHQKATIQCTSGEGHLDLFKYVHTIIVWYILSFLFLRSSMFDAALEVGA